MYSFSLFVFFLCPSFVVASVEPVKGLHLSDSDSQVCFGPSQECCMKFQPGPPPKIESTCQVVEPPPPSPTPITFDIYSSAITVAPGVINRIAGSGWDAMARSNREFNIGDSITVTFNCPDTNGYNMVGFARSNFDDSCTGCYALMPYSVTCSRNSEIHGYELGQQFTIQHCKLHYLHRF